MRPRPDHVRPRTSTCVHRRPPTSSTCCLPVVTGHGGGHKVTAGTENFMTRLQLDSSSLHSKNMPSLVRLYSPSPRPSYLQWRLSQVTGFGGVPPPQTRGDPWTRKQSPFRSGLCVCAIFFFPCHISFPGETARICQEAGDPTRCSRHSANSRTIP